MVGVSDSFTKGDSCDLLLNFAGYVLLYSNEVPNSREQA